MRRFVILLGSGILVTIPVVFFVISQRQKLANQTPVWPLMQTTPVPERYSVESDVPGYTIKLTDTKFLDYVADNIGIFKPNAVVDPESYQGGSTARHTVSHIKFVIIPRVSKTLVAVPGRKDMAAYGDYTVEGDTLVLRVQFSPTETAAIGAGQHTPEATCLLVALQTMQYAHGVSSDPRATLDVLLNVQQGITTYLYNNVLPWPIQISQEK